MALADDLIFSLELDEASGNAIDAHAAYDFTDNNTVGSGTGHVNANARDFERDNSEFFSRATEADIEVGDEDFTMEAWVNHESTSGIQGIAGKWDNAGTDEGWDWYYFGAGGGYTFDVRDAADANTVGVVSSTGSTSESVWNHVVVRHNAATNELAIFVNTTKSTQAHSGGVRQGTSRFTVGKGDRFDGHFDGLMGPFRFWKRALSDSEIQTDLWNDGAGLTYAELDGGGGGGVTLRGRLSLLGVGC